MDEAISRRAQVADGTLRAARGSSTAGGTAMIDEQVRHGGSSDEKQPVSCRNARKCVRGLRSSRADPRRLTRRTEARIRTRIARESAGRSQGVMTITDQQTWRRSEREMRLTAIVADAGIASSEALLSLLATLYRDRPDDFAHAQRVAHVAVRIATELGMPERDIAHLERAAWSHDLMKEFAGRNITWKNAASPLIEGKLVCVGGGGAGHGETLRGRCLFRCDRPRA